MSSRQILVALVAAASLVAPRAARAADTKLAYVDLQRAVAETEEGKAARAKLETARDAKQKEIDKDQEAVRKERETFEKQAATMTEPARNQKGQELQKKIVELQQRFEKGRAELAQQEREMFGPILEKMQATIATIAQREGFTVVMEKAALLYAPPSLDVTNEAIRLYNDKNKVAGATPASTTSGAKKSADTPKK
jgi:outer membrane protein